MEYEVGDIVKLKKKHPCGSFESEILRVGADFRLKGTGCGNQIITARIRAAILAPIRWGARDHKEVKQHDKI